MSHDRKQFLNLAGEFLVAGILNMHFIPSSVTYGASKSADVIAQDIKKEKLYKIEVKTTDKKQWIVGRKLLDQANWKESHFWILVYLPIHGVSAPTDGNCTDEYRGRISPRFFIFTAKELGDILTTHHTIYLKKYRAKHGIDFDAKKGVCTVKFEVISQTDAENAWYKISRKFLPSRPVMPSA